MAGCAVTVLADVRSRKAATAGPVVHESDAAVIHVDFPRSATPDQHALADLVRAAAARHSAVVAIEWGPRSLTFGEIAASMDSLAAALGAFVVDDDSVLTMALMTEIPDLCASGADGLEAALAQLRDKSAVAS